MTTTCYPSLVKGQIQPWIGKQTFAIAPPGAKESLLYTPAPAPMKQWGDPAVLTNDKKMNRVLVPLIPLDARIKMTMLEQIVVAGTTTVDDDLHRTLRTEIMTITHAMQLPHASRVNTIKALRNMAYWPSADTDVQRFCDTCGVCLANRNPTTRLGSSMPSTHRFGAMMI